MSPRARSFWRMPASCIRRGGTGTDQRRTLILAWHKRPRTVPDYWEGAIPEVIANRDVTQEYSGSRIPGEYLRYEAK